MKSAEGSTIKLIIYNMRYKNYRQIQRKKKRNTDTQSIFYKYNIKRAQGIRLGKVGGGRIKMA